MEETQTKIYQVIAKLLDGKSRTLNFLTPIIPIASLKAQIQTLTSIPIHHQLLISDGKTLYDGAVLRHGGGSLPSTVNLLLRLRGGKGGFGSLLRGAATKAGQKKTNNFDACRDMSGRRLRHVNAEKKMEEWLAEEKERKLEKVAEEFIKKKVKAVKKAGGGGDGAEKYVEKYRKDSEKCREEVEKSVRESLGGGGLKLKRKIVGVEVDGSRGGLKAKKLKIWMGKRKMDDSDSDDTDEEDRDVEMGEENEKSAVTNNEKNPSDSSSASVTGGTIEGQSSVGCSSESGSEEEKEIVPQEQPCSVKDSNGVSHGDGVDVGNPLLMSTEKSTVQNSNASFETGIKSVPLETEKPAEIESCHVEERADELPCIGSVQEAGASDVQVKISDSEITVDEETVSIKSGSPDSEKPLNFDEINSAAELEVLGMERLKSELQKRGLKCGGTLSERAARLFLLKTTPLEMLPKKLLAKK